MNDWIRVNDKLPPENKNVLAIWLGVEEDPVIAWLENKEWVLWKSGGIKICAGSVTHWRFIPKVPAEIKKEIKDESFKLF